MRLAHVSDFHYTHLTWNPLRLLSKRFFAHFNWIFNRDKEFSPSQVEPLVSLFQDLKVDLVLLGGDFTTSAMREEFAQAAAFVSQLKQPWIAIPGNHDHYTYRSYRKKLYYQYFTNSPAAYFSLNSDRVEGHKISEGWWVIALDTSQPTRLSSSEGIFFEKVETKLKELLSYIPQEDRIILFNHYPFFQNDTPKHNLKRGEALETIIRSDRRICLYLHGHTHRHIVANLQASGLPLVLDSGSCAQGPKGAWNLIDLEDKGCSLTTYRWNQMWYPSQTESFSWNR